MNWQVNGATQSPQSASWIASSPASFLLRSGPDMLWDEARLLLSFFTSGPVIVVELLPWIVLLNIPEQRIYLSKYVEGNLFSAWDTPIPADSWLDLSVFCSATGLDISFNGQNFSYVSSTPHLISHARVFLSEGSQCTQPELQTREIPAFKTGGLVPKKLEYTVDFYDDLQVAAFNPDSLDEMFRIMAQDGANQVSWIHHGGKGVGFWETSSGAENIEHSFQALGDDYLTAAVTAAHKNNLRIVGVFKPYDTAILHNTVPAPGPANALGGNIKHGFSFPADHPELCLKRRTPPPAPVTVRQITIQSRHQLPDGVDVHIWVSDDNVSYEPYTGPVEIDVFGRTLTLSGLELTSMFIVLEFASEVAALMEGKLADLVQVRNAENQPIEFTYGLFPRLERKTGFHLDRRTEVLDFRTHGLNFDFAGNGVPSAVWNAGLQHHQLFSAANGFLGLALTQNPVVPGTLSEAEPAAVQWWLDMVASMLDASVDAVEIRVQNHGNILDWEQYGFNPALVEEYRNRWDIDITAEEFSRREFRQLRGELFTRFLRRASAMAREQGRQFRMHIEDLHQGPVEESCPMDLYLPWRSWLEEGLCDGVTLKSLNLWTHETAFGREVIAACHEKNIPVTYTPFVHSAFSNPHRETLLSSYEHGSFDALNIYEFASLYKFDAEGRAQDVAPEVTQWLHSQSWERTEQLIHE